MNALLDWITGSSRPAHIVQALCALLVIVATAIPAGYLMSSLSH